MPDGLPRLLASRESTARKVCGQLGLAQDWSTRWDTLSHGERKRCQIAVALWKSPEVLAVDEPTNHVDRPCRNLVRDALRSFLGIGLLVSHDRDLLDELCSSCVFVDPPRAILRPGGYTQGRTQAGIEQVSQQREHRKAQRAFRQLAIVRAERKAQEFKAERARSRHGVGKRDHDERAKRNLARLTDGGSGQRLRQLDGRMSQTAKWVDETRMSKTHALGIQLSTSRSMRNTLLDCPAASIALGPCRCLHVPHLTLQPTDSVAVVGPNGVGKSTLIQWLIGRLNLPSHRLGYLPQEIDTSRAASLVERLRQLSNEERGQVLTVFSRLGSRPERVLGSVRPSPGELRKLSLALDVAQGAELLVLDEPTNHLDLPSIECLEEALTRSEAALLLVSHDERFLSKLVTTRWVLSPTKDGNSELQK